MKQSVDDAFDDHPTAAKRLRAALATALRQLGDP